jgi:ABC-type transporter Mla MlaB component
MDFSVEYTITDEGIVVLVISGSMDVETAPQLRDLVVRLIDEGHHPLVLDLSGVDFIDSIGLGVIVGVGAPAPSARRLHGGGRAVGTGPSCSSDHASGPRGRAVRHEGRRGQRRS